MYINTYSNLQRRHADYEAHDTKELKASSKKNVIPENLMKRHSFIRFCDENVIARITSVYFAAILGVQMIVYQLTAAVDNISSGIITRDLSRWKEAGKNAADAVISAIVFPAIGIAGFVMPKTAIRVSKIIRKKLKPFLSSRTAQKEFGCIGGRIISPARGVCRGVLSFTAGVKLILLSPFTKDTAEKIVQGTKYILKTLHWPLCGISGIVFESSRKELGINP